MLPWICRIGPWKAFVLKSIWLESRLKVEYNYLHNDAPKVRGFPLRSNMFGHFMELNTWLRELADRATLRHCFLLLKRLSNHFTFHNKRFQTLFCKTNSPFPRQRVPSIQDDLNYGKSYLWTLFFFISRMDIYEDIKTHFAISFFTQIK